MGTKTFFVQRPSGYGTSNANTPTETRPPRAEDRRAAQEGVGPDLVILFGSRAAGDHREDSDVDILVVTDREHHGSAGAAAERAAQDYIRQNPPELELGIISMTRQTFDRCRRANQHIAGQAARHGIPMVGTAREPGDEPEPGPDDHWPATLQ